MIFVLLLNLLLAGAPQATKNNEPLVSATNPTYLSCTFWTGKTFSKLEARSARTAVVRSPKGFLAYGEVKVEVQGDDCENTTTLYVATGEGKEFKAVYKKDGGGNGVRVIGWSPSGERLLAEITSWIYESDTGFEYTPVIYDSATSTAQENSAMEKALKDHLGNCSYAQPYGLENEHKSPRESLTLPGCRWIRRVLLPQTAKDVRLRSADRLVGAPAAASEQIN